MVRLTYIKDTKNVGLIIALHKLRLYRERHRPDVKVLPVDISTTGFLAHNHAMIRDLSKQWNVR